MKAFNFEGSGLEYFKIWIVNILLTIVTLGLYYPWAKVRNKRYIYGNSTLENRNFDYHATGKQLFIGYLISMSLLIAYIVIQQVSPIGSLIVLLLFLLALPWIIWRSLKFNMHMTSFSNVRFGFDGNLGGAYFNYMLLPALFFLALYSGPILIGIVTNIFGISFGSFAIILTTIIMIVGIVISVYMFAYLKKRNASYTIDSSRYGQARFSTNLETSVFIKIFLKAAGLFILALIGYMILLAIISSITGISNNLLALSGSLGDPEAMGDIFQSSGVIGLIALFYIGFTIISILIFSYTFSRQRAYILANTVLDGEIKLASTLKALPLAWISISNFLAIILTLGLAIPWATVRLTRFILQHTKVDTSVDLNDYVSQQEEKQSSLGEQLGDAFDVDVGLGI